MQHLRLLKALGKGRRPNEKPHMDKYDLHGVGSCRIRLSFS